VNVGARYVIHRDDWSYFTTEEQMQQRPHLRVAPLGGAGLVDLVDGESEIVPGLRAVPTPGHTPGHMSIWLESGDDVLCLLGDVVVHEAQVADPDVAYVSDADARASAATRREVLGRLADDGTDVHVSHFHGVGRFLRDGSGFRWTAKEQAPPVE
jgi:glyoxylase-like metal-dependent hydrolase (beta-lactamase superfamily II)